MIHYDQLPLIFVLFIYCPLGDWKLWLLTPTKKLSKIVHYNFIKNGKEIGIIFQCQCFELNNYQKGKCKKSSFWNDNVEFPSNWTPNLLK